MTSSPSSVARCSLPDRINDRIRVNPETGCWEWVGTRRPDGYGVITVDGRLCRAHRYVFTLLRGDIPEGLVLDHLCRVPRCVNPDHLEPVTQRINTLRGVGPIPERAQQTHCIHGHEFVGHNVYIHPKRGTRNCRTCLHETSRRRRAGLAGTGDCSVDNCTSPAVSRGMCPSHYQKAYRYGQVAV